MATWDAARAAERRSAGLCVDCPDPASPVAPGRVRCRKCLDRAALYGRVRTRRKHTPRPLLKIPRVGRVELKRLGRQQPTEANSGFRSALFEKHVLLSLWHECRYENRILRRQIRTLLADIDDLENELKETKKD